MDSRKEQREAERGQRRRIAGGRQREGNDGGQPEGGRERATAEERGKKSGKKSGKKRCNSGKNS